MVDRFDIPYVSIIDFLHNNNVNTGTSNREEHYEKAWELMQNQNSNFEPIVIIEWMKAYNLILLNTDIKIYTIDEIENMSGNDLINLSKLLTMKSLDSTKLVNLIHILYFMHKLNINTNLLNLPRNIINKELSKIPPPINVGDIGTNHFNTGYGRQNWKGFMLFLLVLTENK